MWTRKQLLIAILMVVTGSLNTLSTKWADKISSKGVDGEYRVFDHPYLQAASMFLGEMMCLVAFKLVYFYKKRKSGEYEDIVPLVSPSQQDFNVFIFLPPALLDMLGTSTMYVGLNLTYASSFQMLRGAVIIFTGLLSVAFLDRVLKWIHWIGIVVIMLGLGIVGTCDFIVNSGSGVNVLKNNIITGDLLIIMAQIIVACQMVYEEKFINKHNIPALQAVGWEGIFGFSTLCILLFPMYYIPVSSTFQNNPRGVLEDAIDGLTQLSNSVTLSCAVAGTVISIAFFNFAGVSVTKELSATTRMVLDSIRTLVIWLVSLAIGWQDFNALQILGFLLLLVGMCLYNRVVIEPLLSKWGVWPSPSSTDGDEPVPDAVFDPPEIRPDVET